MPTERAPWWMFLIAASLVMAVGLSIWTDVMGPERVGWLRAGDAMRVTQVVPGGPFARAEARPATSCWQ